MVSTKELLEGLEEELKIFSSNPDEMYRKWTVARNQFHNYSLRNLLIANQQLYSRKERYIEKLASYNAWKKLGRQVRKGEKSLKILAPLIRKNDKGEEEIFSFKQVSVFDISQTDGDDLFYSDEDIVGKCTLSLNEVINNSYLPVYIILDEQLKRGETNYNEIKVSKMVSDDEKICIIFHELAHNLLEHNTRENISSSLKEMEAESVSYIVAKHFGIDNKGSIRYIHNWNKDNVDEFDLTSANMIMDASNKIVTMMEG